MTAFSPCQGQLLLVLNCLVCRVTRSLSGSIYIYAHKLKYIYIYIIKLFVHIHIFVCIYIYVLAIAGQTARTIFFSKFDFKKFNGQPRALQLVFFYLHLFSSSILVFSFSTRYFFNVLSVNKDFWK